MGVSCKYKDLDCSYCLNKKRLVCKYNLCPHIMENLKSLDKDENFHKAVMDAENCESSHRFTLVYLKKKIESVNMSLLSDMLSMTIVFSVMTSNRNVKVAVTPLRALYATAGITAIA